MNEKLKVFVMSHETMTGLYQHNTHDLPNRGVLNPFAISQGVYCQFSHFSSMP